MNLKVKNLLDILKEEPFSYYNAKNVVDSFFRDKSLSLTDAECEAIDVAFCETRWEYYLKFLVKNFNYKFFSNRSDCNYSTVCKLTAFLSKKYPYFLDDVRMIIVDFIWKTSPENVFDKISIIDPVIFQSKSDLISFVMAKSKSSLRAFSSAMALFQNHLSEKESKFFLSKLEKTINKLKPNAKNISLISRSLTNKKIVDWIRSNSDLKNNIKKFLWNINARDLQAKNLEQAKIIASIYYGDQESILNFQENYIRSICVRYIRHEKRILEFLKIESTSARKAFLQLTDLNRGTGFLFSKFPELKKLVTFS
jgi:hypothetical protein